MENEVYRIGLDLGIEDHLLFGQDKLLYCWNSLLFGQESYNQSPIPFHDFDLLKEERENVLKNEKSFFILSRYTLKNPNVDEKDIQTFLKSWYLSEIDRFQELLCKKAINRTAEVIFSDFSSDHITIFKNGDPEYLVNYLNDFSDRLSVQKYIDWCSDKRSQRASLKENKPKIKNNLDLEDYLLSSYSLKKRRAILSDTKKLIVEPIHTVYCLLALEERGCIERGLLTTRYKNTARSLADYYEIEETKLTYSTVSNTIRPCLKGELIITTSFKRIKDEIVNILDKYQ